MDAELIREILYKKFGNKAIYRCGSSSKIQYNMKAFPEKADMAIYIHQTELLLVIWDLARRRRLNRPVSSCSISESWIDIRPVQGMKAVYKSMEKRNSSDQEKVLIMEFDALPYAIDSLYVYLQPNPDDEEYRFSKVKQDAEDEATPLLDEFRKTVSTKIWARDWRFRKEVLKAYGYRCAVCRCSAPELLQAAHITGVAQGGSDDSRNGICLCANHHLMYDRGLIKISGNRLTYVADSVKNMTWYHQFLEDGEELLGRL